MSDYVCPITGRDRRGGYSAGCRCSGCTEANATYEAARRGSAVDRARAKRHGGGNVGPLHAANALLGRNAIDPEPLARFAVRRGLSISRSIKSAELNERIVPGGSKAGAQLSKACDRGWISEKALDEICCLLGTHPATLYGDAYFDLVCQDATYDELVDAGVVQRDLEAVPA